MNAPFNAFAAYEREREENRRLYGMLFKAVTILRLDADRREARGEDVSHVRAFIKEASA